MSDFPGKKLQAAREARGLSVEDITTATKMRPFIVAALEADDYSAFPSITHARSFLVLYGKHLQVDVQEGVASLATPAKMGIENYQYLNVEHEEDTSYRPQRRRTNSHSQSEQTLRTLGIIALVIAFLFFAVYLAINLQRLNLAAVSPSSPTNIAKVEDSPPPTPLDSNSKSEPQADPKVDKLLSPTPEPSSAPFHAPTLENRRLLKPPPWPRF